MYCHKIKYIIQASMFFLVLLHGSCLNAQDVDKLTATVVEEIKPKVSGEVFEFYEKFSRIAVKKLKIENATEEELQYLTQALKIYVKAQNEKNETLGKLAEISIEVREHFKAEIDRITGFDLKESYQIWLENKKAYDANVSLIKKNIESFFDKNSFLVFDVNANAGFLSKSKVNKDPEGFTKSALKEYLNKAIKKQKDILNEKYDSLLYFNKKTPALIEQENVATVEDSFNKLLLKKEDVFIVGDFSEIDSLVAKVLSHCLDQQEFREASYNLRNLLAQIYRRKRYKALSIMSEGIPLHYGRSIDQKFMENLFIPDRHPRFEADTPHEVAVLAVSEHIYKIESVHLFEKFVFSLFVALKRDIKINSRDEEVFVFAYYYHWSAVSYIYRHENRRRDGFILPEAFEVFRDIIDDLILMEKDVLASVVEDKVQSQQDKILSEIGIRTQKIQKEYFHTDVTQKKYEPFKDRLRAWIQKYHRDLLTKQQTEDIFLREKLRTFSSILRRDMWKKELLKKDAYKNQEYDINNIFRDSEEKLLALNLITYADIEEGKLAEYKLTPLDLALYHYVKIAKETNPMFKSTEPDYANLERGYWKYDKEGMDEKEKNAINSLAEQLNKASEERFIEKQKIKEGVKK